MSLKQFWFVVRNQDDKSKLFWRHNYPKKNKKTTTGKSLPISFWADWIFNITNNADDNTKVILVVTQLNRNKGSEPGHRSTCRCLLRTWRCWAISSKTWRLRLTHISVRAFLAINAFVKLSVDRMRWFVANEYKRNLTAWSAYWCWKYPQSTVHSRQSSLCLLQTGLPASNHLGQCQFANSSQLAIMFHEICWVFFALMISTLYPCVWFIQSWQKLNN